MFIVHLIDSSLSVNLNALHKGPQFFELGNLFGLINSRDYDFRHIWRFLYGVTRNSIVLPELGCSTIDGLKILFSAIRLVYCGHCAHSSLFTPLR